MIQLFLIWLKNALLSILADNRGFVGGEGEGSEETGDGESEGNAEGEGGQEGAGGKGNEAGAGEEEGEGKGEGEEEGEGGEGSEAEGKYGEFGDDAEALFKAFTDIKGKTTSTETNLATLRSAADRAGLVLTGDGQLVRKLASQEGQRQTKFTEDHGKLFDPKVLSAIRALLEDTVYDYHQFSTKGRAAEKAFDGEQKDANNLMFELFPDIKNKKSALWDLASDIYDADPKLQKNPKGELYAAHEAAMKLGITPGKVSEAFRKGLNAGKSGKKILAKLGGGSGGGGKKLTPKVGKGELTYQELMSKTPEERRKIQEVWAKNKQAGG